jgi:glycerate kinase
MKILIAPDSFKNALSAMQAGAALKNGVLRALPGAEIKVVPMADGGEGTVESLIDATGGRIVKEKVHDPLMRERESHYGITGDGRTAVIEMAAASGIQMIRREERDPWITTTYGTGELIRSALDNECRTVFLGIGGSATIDCGTGMAMALGARFIKADGDEAAHGGGELGEIRKIDLGRLDKRIRKTEILVACDVSNPLTGPNGASHVYGPQKGADETMVKMLDSNLVVFASLIRSELGLDVENLPGAGAAGGLGAGLLAFLGAKLVKGVDAIAGMINLEKEIKWADLIITGEGAIDFQTQYGKTPFGVAQIAKRHKKPVIALAGSIGEGSEVLYKKGLDAIIPITDAPLTLEESIRRTPELLEATGERIGRMLSLKL